MKAMSTRRVSSTRSACSPTAACVMPADPAAEQLQGHRRERGESCGDRHRVGDDDELAVGGHQSGDACGGGACVQQHAGPAQWEELGRGGGDGVLVVGAGGLPLADARLDEVQRARGNRAAVHPADDAGPVECGQVAADGLGGDVVGLSELGDRCAPLADHQSGDRLLGALRRT